MLGSAQAKKLSWQFSASFQAHVKLSHRNERNLTDGQSTDRVINLDL